MKVAKIKELSVNDDPRPTDRVVFNRLRLMVEHEACHPAWGCILYRLHRLGRIDNDQKEAGDRYQQLVQDFGRAQATDPDEASPAARELVMRRIERAKARYKDAVGLLGVGRKWVDAVVMGEEWPNSERAHLIVFQGLRLLANFFATGTKSKRNVV